MSTIRTWRKGKKTIKGWCTYNRGGDFFFIELEKKNPITGGHDRFTVYGDEPNFNGWTIAPLTEAEL